MAGPGLIGRCQLGTASEYISSTTPAKRAVTSDRFTFSVGVSSPPAIVEFPREHPPVLDALDPGVLGVDPGDRRLQLVEQLGIRDQVLHLVELAVGGRPRGEGIGVEREQRHQVGPVVADDDRLGDERLEPQRRLDLLRRDVLARRRDDEVLRATRDGQIAVAVQPSGVPRVHPPVGVQQVLGRHRVVQLSGRDDFPLTSTSPSPATRISTFGAAGPTVPIRIAPGGFSVVTPEPSVCP